MYEPEVLDGAGENELVDEQDDGLGGLFLRGPLDLGELGEPDLQVLEELLGEFRLVRRVFETAQGVQHAARLAATSEEIGEGQLAKRLVVEEVVAGVEEPGCAQVGEDQVFVIAEVLLDLGDVLLGVGIAAPEGVGAVALEQGLEFER